MDIINILLPVIGLGVAIQGNRTAAHGNTLADIELGISKEEQKTSKEELELSKAAAKLARLDLIRESLFAIKFGAGALVCFLLTIVVSLWSVITTYDVAFLQLAVFNTIITNDSSICEMIIAIVYPFSRYIDISILVLFLVNCLYAAYFSNNASEFRQASLDNVENGEDGVKDERIITDLKKHEGITNLCKDRNHLKLVKIEGILILLSVILHLIFELAYNYIKDQTTTKWIFIINTIEILSIVFIICLAFYHFFIFLEEKNKKTDQ